MSNAATFELRPSRYDHEDAVALTERAQRYYLSLYGAEDRDPLTAAEFAPPRGGFLIGYLAGVPVAMGGWLFYGGAAPLSAVRPAQIRRMYVQARVRRQRIGGMLLNGLEGAAAAAGADLMILTTGRPQVEAVAFYRAAGYLDVPPFGFYAASDGAVHLGKRLRPLPPS